MSPNTKMYVLLFSLYWAQGLPVGFMTHALPVILRAEGVSLTHIGGFGLLMAPWALKVLWAPLVDRHHLFNQGHYRSWIVPTQLLTIITLIILSFIPIQSLNQPQYLFGFFVALLMMNSIGATQDIATDGLAVNILKGEQQHLGNMFQVIGSRLGFIVGGGAILWVLDALTWQTTFLCLAILVAFNTLPVLLYREPQHASQSINNHRDDDSSSKTQSFVKALSHYLKYFFQNRELRLWFFVLCSIKVTDGLSGPILKPLLVDLGLSKTQIGVNVTMLGAFAALIGAGIAGWLLRFYSRQSALITFSLLKLLSLIGFAWLSHYEARPSELNVVWIYMINALEDMFAAMLLVIILTFVMQYSRKEFAGTDFTFQVALMASIAGALYTLSGILGDWLGYTSYLILICILGLFLFIPILVWSRYTAQNKHQWN
ncbi:MFS transporter [Acinetobacter sp. YH12239]|uniref:MFS transporter n=1 Tax=Acinetobacter sp. YH12239 TaxID=2601166 RepID=UPI0015D2A6D3|nr:MFS transporter [Acinetobacter sp. YH12239]